MYRQNQENKGSFIEKEFENEFTYRLTKHEWAIQQGYEHEIDVGFVGDIRFGNVKRTVAYILCDDAEGNTVEQKWALTKNTVFNKENT